MYSHKQTKVDNFLPLPVPRTSVFQYSCGIYYDVKFVHCVSLGSRPNIEFQKLYFWHGYRPDLGFQHRLCQVDLWDHLVSQRKESKNFNMKNRNNFSHSSMGHSVGCLHPCKGVKPHSPKRRCPDYDFKLHRWNSGEGEDPFITITPLILKHLIVYFANKSLWLLESFSLESEWQQLSSSLQGSFQYSGRRLISKSSSPVNNHLVTVPKVRTTIGIIFAFMFLSFFNSLTRSRYLFFFSLSFNFILWSAGTANSQFCKFSLLLLLLLLYIDWKKIVLGIK